jgi:hypothetical protein
MNRNTMAKYYRALTPEERFRLIVAAGDRGDEAEQDRLANAGGRITLSSPDHAPFARALQELAMIVFLELTEEAAKHDDAWHRWEESSLMDLLGGKAGAEAKPDNEPEERPEGAIKANAITDRLLYRYLAQGFFLRTKVEGWKLFCDRLGISPWGLWQYLPGFERLRKRLKAVDGTDGRPSAVFTPAGMVSWLNLVRPGDQPGTEADLPRAAKVAHELDKVFCERARWWGAG